MLDRQIETRPATAAPPLRRIPLAQGALIGRLAIPRLNVRSVVREGAGQDTLDLALGHIPGTALPGQPGNVGVAGHRDTLFRGLRNVEKNDVILFQTPAATYRYQVESTAIVKPQEVDVLNAGFYPEMTLVTCYPFNYVGSAPDRFIVKARLLSPPPPPALVPVRQPLKKTPHPERVRRVNFRVNNTHTRELAPGILLGVTATDPARKRASGWLWVSAEHRTIWLRNQAALQPISLGSRQVTLTQIAGDSVAGYLSSPPLPK